MIPYTKNERVTIARRVSSDLAYAPEDYLTRIPEWLDYYQQFVSRVEDVYSLDFENEREQRERQTRPRLTPELIRRELSTRYFDMG